MGAETGPGRHRPRRGEDRSGPPPRNEIRASPVVSPRPPAPLPPRPAADDDGSVVPLRPYGLGTMYAGMVRVLRAAPATVVGAALLGFAITAAIRVAAGPTEIETRRLDSLGYATLTTRIRYAEAGVAALSGIATVVVGGVLVPLTLRLVAGQRARGRPGRPELRAGVGSLLVGVLGAPGTALLTFGAGRPGVLLLGVPLTLVGAYVGTRLAVLPAVQAGESRAFGPGLARCWTVSRGSWWRTLGLTFMFALPGSLVAAAAGGVGVLRASQQPIGVAVATPSQELAAAVALGALLTLPMSAIGTALLYVDLRCRKEGLAWQLDAARRDEARPAFGAGGTYGPPP